MAPYENPHFQALPLAPASIEAAAARQLRCGAARRGAAAEVQRAARAARLRFHLGGLVARHGGTNNGGSSPSRCDGWI